MWVCTRKFVCRKNLGVKIPCLTPQVNLWGSFDPRDPTVPAPLASTHLAVRAVARKNDASVGHLVTLRSPHVSAMRVWTVYTNYWTVCRTDHFIGFLFGSFIHSFSVC